MRHLGETGHPSKGEVWERESDMDNATLDGLSQRMADTYNGSKLPVKFLTASGWGPLLNLGYFELKQLPSLIGGLNHFQRYLVKKSVELLNPQPNESILDLACGNGWTTQFIAQHGSKTTGLDLCEPHSNLHKVTLTGNINFIQGDATHLENVAL
jgi:SAM-dependent methyltransferase